MKRRSPVSAPRRFRATIRRQGPNPYVDVPSLVSAREAFDALSPSHRRGLVRYIDDARTPSTRAKRVAKTIDHLLGTPTPAAARGEPRPLWTCPRCGNEFVNRNQYHACKRYELEALFEGKPARIRGLYDLFHHMVERCGPAKVLPYREKVAYMVRVRFAGAVPKANWLDVGFWLPRRVVSPRFRKVETIYPNAHVHFLRITDENELDAELAGWLAEAYEVGCQRHLA